MNNNTKEWKVFRIIDFIKEFSEKTTINNQHELLSVTKDGIFSQKYFFKKQIASENNIGYKIVRKGNVVFSAMNLWMGAIDIVEKNKIGIVSPSYVTLKVDERLINLNFLKYLLKSASMKKKYIYHSQQGASIVRRNLNKKDLFHDSVKLPPIDQQIKISEILLLFDSVIEKLTAQINKLLLTKKGIQKDVFSNSKNLNSFFKKQLSNSNNVEEDKFQPRKIRIGDVAEINPKTNFKKDLNATVSFLSMKDTDENSEIISLQIKQFKEVAKGYTKFKEGDILVAKITPCFENGKGAFALNLIDKRGFGSTEFHIIRIKTDIANNKFIHYLTKSYLFRNSGKRSMRGSAGQQRVPADFIENYEFYLPPILIQNKIVQIFDSIELKIQKIQKKVTYFEKLKKSIELELLSGEKSIKGLL